MMKFKNATLMCAYDGQTHHVHIADVSTTSHDTVDNIDETVCTVLVFDVVWTLIYPFDDDIEGKERIGTYMEELYKVEQFKTSASVPT